MGISPTSLEVPRTSLEGGAQPLPGRRDCQGSGRDYFLQSSRTQLTLPSRTRALAPQDRSRRKKSRTDPLAIRASLGRRAQRRIVLDGHGGGCPSHTPF